MSRPVTHANASRPVNNPQQDYCNPYPYPPRHGSKYPWISSPSSPKPRPDMMQLWSLWTPSPKWYTSLQPRPLLQLLKQPNSSLSTSSDYCNGSLRFYQVL